VFRRSVLLLACISTRALADPAAEKLFQDGRAALAAGKLDEACDAFRRSDAIEPRVGTLLNLADCEERRGKLATAWGHFVEAEARARQVNDSRIKEATKRAAALAPKLPYLTIAIPTQARVAGLTLKRNEVVIAPAQWDQRLPVDPGTHEVQVEAPGHLPWRTTVVLAEAKADRIEVPVLAPAPSDSTSVHQPPSAAVPPGSSGAGADAAPTAAAPPRHHIAIGLLTGLSSDLDWINGGRVVLNAAPLGAGVLRVVPSVMYTSTTDPDDVYLTYTLIAIGGTLEYAHPITTQLVAAGGIGFGVDLYSDSYENSSKDGWGAARASLAVRFGRLDIGLHVQLVATSDRVVTLGELGVDYFVW
jgi:hypothetical protein